MKLLKTNGQTLILCEKMKKKLFQKLKQAVQIILQKQLIIKMF